MQMPGTAPEAGNKSLASPRAKQCPPAAPQLRLSHISPLKQPEEQKVDLKQHISAPSWQQLRGTGLGGVGQFYRLLYSWIQVLEVALLQVQVASPWC